MSSSIGGKRGRQDQQDRSGGLTGAPTMHDDALGFHLRQSLMRALERNKLGKLRHFDRLFLIFVLYYDDRTSREATTLLKTTVRLPFDRPTDFLGALDDRGVNEVLSEITELRSAAAATSSSGDAADPLSSSSSTERHAFWGLCSAYCTSLLAARALDEASKTMPPIDARVGVAVQDLLQRSAAQLAKLIVELRALARCPSRGLDRTFFGAVVVVAEFLRAECDLDEFHERFEQGDPPSPPSERQTAAAALVADPTRALSEEEMAAIMAAQGETLEADQQLVSDEVAMVSTLPPPAALAVDDASSAPGDVAPQPADGGRGSGGPWHGRPSMMVQRGGRGARSWMVSGIAASRAADGLKKPERFGKVITGYSWHKYNRTHYSGSQAPPPKTVMAYEFTLLYPELDPSTGVTPTYRVEPTEHGWDDAYCFIVFSAPPPYADVAYRIVNKQWDKRSGGRRCTFEPGGRFRLYFRFASTFYRR